MFTNDQRLGGRIRVETEPTRGSINRTDRNDFGALRTTTPESIMSLHLNQATVGEVRSPRLIRGAMLDGWELRQVGQCPVNSRRHPSDLLKVNLSPQVGGEGVADEVGLLHIVRTLQQENEFLPNGRPVPLVGFDPARNCSRAGSGMSRNGRVKPATFLRNKWSLTPIPTLTTFRTVPTIGTSLRGPGRATRPMPARYSRGPDRPLLCRRSSSPAQARHPYSPPPWPSALNSDIRTSRPERRDARSSEM